MQHGSGGGTIHLVGLKGLPVHVKWVGRYLSAKIVGKASARPGPLTIRRDNESLAKRHGRLSCSFQARRLDAVIVRDKD
jgi:hypothetical protein